MDQFRKLKDLEMMNLKEYYSQLFTIFLNAVKSLIIFWTRVFFNIVSECDAKIQLQFPSDLASKNQEHASPQYDNMQGTNDLFRYNPGEDKAMKIENIKTSEIGQSPESCQWISKFIKTFLKVWESSKVFKVKIKRKN